MDFKFLSVDIHFQLSCDFHLTVSVNTTALISDLTDVQSKVNCMKKRNSDINTVRHKA